MPMDMTQHSIAFNVLLGAIARTSLFSLSQSVTVCCDWQSQQTKSTLREANVQAEGLHMHVRYATCMYAMLHLACICNILARQIQCAVQLRSLACHVFY